MADIRRYLEAVARSNALSDISRWSNDELLDVVALHGEPCILDAWAARTTAMSKTPDAESEESTAARAFLERVRARVAAGDPNVSLVENPVTYPPENSAAGPA